MKPKSGYEKDVRKAVKKLGGFYNAHSHGDRAYTYRNKFYPDFQDSVALFESKTLSEKQKLVWRLHKGPAFKKKSLRKRMTRLLDDSIRFGVTRLNSCIDVTYNTGLKGWEVACELKEKYQGKIDFKIGAYNVSGFRDGEEHKKRWDYFEEAAKTADFLVALAEKDRNSGHIGEEEHNVYFLNKGIELGIPVHFHVGQENRPTDRGAELLFENMRHVYKLQHRLSENEYPENYLIHDISAACYNEDDFQKHVDSLLEYRLSVVSCPTAAVSMLQDRGMEAPIHNSIARVWDYVLNEIPVFVGSDNVNDVFVPGSNADVFDELVMLNHALRLSNPEIIAKLASGTEFEDFDRGIIQRTIYPLK